MTVSDALIIGAVALLWGWFLGKPLLAHRLGSLRPDRIGTFHRQLGALSDRRPVGRPVAGRAGAVASRRQQAARRRQIFLSLVISVVVSLLLAVALGGVFVDLQITMDVLLVGYVSLAVLAGRQRPQREGRVVTLRHRPATSGGPAYARAVGDA